MSPTVSASEPLRKKSGTSRGQRSQTFSVIVHKGGKVNRRLSRNDSSPYFIPISNHEGKLYFDEATNDNAIDNGVQQFELVRHRQQSPSELSSSGCSSIMEEQQLDRVLSPIECRCNSTNTSDYDDNDSFPNSPPYPHLVRHHNHYRHQKNCRTNQYYQNANNTRGLIEIAMRTIKLIRRNQELQKRLSDLQRETNCFIETVMANPENKNLRSPVASE